jgi:gliding motility-associated-like protein
MKKIIFLLELGLFLMSINLFSQAYLINTNYCIVSNHTYLIVNGHLNNQSSGNLYLTGTNSNVIIQNNITNNGTINSYGIIDLYGDWINNSTYTQNNTSYVYLKGANQNIGGSTTTTFYNLYLQGTGVKTLGNNQNVDGTLNLNDRELATQNYTMTVNNPLVASVQRTTGFVSSTVGGGLARATNSTSTYLYPVGSSGKYRPADITPSSTTASIYKVRMANVDASSEGYNRNNKASDICEVNPSFFHIMQQTSGTSNNANIKVYYDNTIDGSWDKVGNWNGSLWNNYTGSSTSSGSPLYYGIANNVSLSSSTPIALTKNAPVLTASASPSSICSGSSTTLSASGASTYSWTDGTNNYTGNSINVSPTSNTTYTVTGTIGTCSATATVSVTVNPSPSLTVNATPSSICQGNNATLSASGASTYSWTDGTNNYTGNNVTVTPTLNTTYTVTGTIGTCSATATVSVTVNAAPSLTVNATDNQLCTGESATLTANGANTYNWSHSLGSGSSKTVSPTSTTTYTVTGTTAEGCSNTASISITVNPVPNVSANASPNTICIGGSSTLSASGANTYLWSNGSSGASITVSPNSTTTYTVIGASTAGCTNTATITVYVSTTINITANANPSSICEGAYSILSASGADTYNWSNSMNLSTITVTPTNTTSYTVTGYSGGCTGTATVSVTVNPLPTMIASANPSSICYNEVTTLTASGANNYSWSHSLGTGSNVTVTPTTNTTYTVTGTNIYNCSNTASVSVVVNPIPTVNITASSTTICQGDQTILTATGADSYSWYHGLGTNNIITVSPSSTTTYTVVGTNTAGCSATASIAITVNPNADATINPIDPLCDNQEQITLTAHTSGGLWSGTGITNQVLGTFSPAIAGTGTHAITYMISGMCGDTATTEISIYDSPDATAYATDETCIDANDGIAWVEVTGGTPPYAFLWSTYHTLDSIANLAPGEYYVTANDFHNCSDKDTVLIKPGTEDCYITHIYVPNIFSPDDKGNPENEYLRVYGKGIKSIDFKIFDRWGNEVFHTTDINLGWDGTYKGEPALTGDYTYILKVSYTKKPDDIIKGHIYLIR